MPTQKPGLRREYVNAPESTESPVKFARRENFAALTCIVLLGILTYGHTLNVPWYMDDLRAIVENRSIHQLQQAFAELFTVQRGFANLTFALNYRFGGTDVTGYHLVNIGIHLATSCLVFLLLKRVFRERLLLALGGALIFVAHPLQTQAVTYIVQRMTSLAALFFFLAIYLFIRYRETPESRLTRARLFYAGALLCGTLAVHIKQNTAILPVALVLFERYFLPAEGRSSWRHLLVRVAPFAVVPGVLAAYSLLVPMLSGQGISHVGGMPDLVHLRHLSPLNYLVTEFSVIWLYLRLLFLPFGQVLDYDYPIVATIWQWKNLIAFLGVATLLTTAALLRKRLPYVSAGILWFFLALAVESTIIPLDPVFEHRLYLPMFGFALVVMTAITGLPRKAGLVATVLIIAALAVLTWKRNDLWNDQQAFYEDNLRRAPASERVHLDLANVYRKQGRLSDAQQLYERALEINPDYVLIHINLSIIYSEQKNPRKAVDILLEGIRRNPSHFKLFNNIGVLYNFLGEYSLASAYLKKAVALEPDEASVYFNLGLAYDKQGLLDQAIAQYRRSIALNDRDPAVHFNLGNALFSQGATQSALQAFLNAYKLNPRNAGVLYNAGLVFLELGDVQSARNFAAQLQTVNGEMAKKLERKINPGQ